jgi:hypothetical protein
LVGATPDGKKLINSNVAIEYGHAHHALNDTSILMIQNTHYGNRDQLPFDLRHKAGPIQLPAQQRTKSLRKKRALNLSWSTRYGLT